MRVQFIFYMTILKHISSIQCFLTANISATSTSRHPSGLENTAAPVRRRGEVAAAELIPLVRAGYLLSLS